MKKQCKNCYEYHKERRTGDQKNKRTYSCQKKTNDQYVEIIKENNPGIIKSIMEHRNDVAAGDRISYSTTMITTSTTASTMRSTLVK